MNPLISLSDWEVIQQVERQLSDFLREALRQQTLNEADQWLYSVWANQPDWPLLERILRPEGNPATATSIPVLMGCLQWARQHQTNARQTALCQQLEAVAYHQARNSLNQGRTGMLTGGAAQLNYLLLSSAYSEEAGRHADWLIDGVLNNITTTDQIRIDLTLGGGQTGLVLSLVEALKIAKTKQRIYVSVSKVNGLIHSYISYLSRHQIPIDSQAGNFSFFPISVTGPEWEISQDLSWEMGDAGQLLLLCQAESLMNQVDSRRWVNRLLDYHLTRRVESQVRIDHLGLSNGVAGLSLVYRRLYQITGRNDFLTEGEYWLRQLAQAVQTGNTGNDRSLLTGTLGMHAVIRHWLGESTGLDLLCL